MKYTFKLCSGIIARFDLRKETPGQTRKRVWIDSAAPSAPSLKETTTFWTESRLQLVHYELYPCRAQAPLQLYPWFSTGFNSSDLLLLPLRRTGFITFAPVGFKQLASELYPYLICCCYPCRIQTPLLLSLLLTLSPNSSSCRQSRKLSCCCSSWIQTTSPLPLCFVLAPFVCFIFS